jgi:hypothetical protein
MFYTIYKITNLFNNKIYIGSHKTLDINDAYMGSGKVIRYAIKKHGVDNFYKEILYIYDNISEMFQMESLLVNKDFVERLDTYNLKIGGDGGFDFININRLNNKDHEKNRDVSVKAMSYATKRLMAEDQDYNSRLQRKRLDTLFSNSILKYGNKSEIFKTFTGKKHNAETKKKISEKISLIQKGEGNSQFGTIWIFNSELKENKKIKKEDFDIWVENGWLKGRKNKF